MFLTSFKKMRMKVWRMTGPASSRAIMGSACKLLAVMALCYLVIVLKFQKEHSKLLRSLFDGGVKPLYADVNVKCLKQCHLNYGEIVLKHKREEREVDITDWDADKICKLTEEESEYERVIFDDIYNSKSPSDGQPHVTYVTHFSFDRLDKFIRVVQHWPGSISAAVQIPADQVEQFVNDYCRRPELYNRDNVGLHLVLQKGIFYPYNHYRNIALERAKTSHVFVTDIDLVPSDDLETRALRHFQSGAVQGNEVLVVPSFEITKEVGYTVPYHKEDLLRIWDLGELQEFYATRYAPAYMPLNYTIWRTADKPYEVQYWSEFEPYIIAEKTKLQPYTNRFVGRFYNKATHIAELFCRGFKFIIAPDVFNVHVPHESIHEKAFDAYFRCIYQLFTAYKSHLENTYGVKLPPKAPLKPDGT